MSTKPSVFVIESLGYEDERAQRYEGRILREILRLSGKLVRYIYIRTRKELRFALQQFRKSDMRYLHISCHGSAHSIALTLDSLTFKEFGNLARPYLDGRRLFLSACEVATDNLAREILLNSSCYSVIGPADAIEFSDAALIWASFYHLAFRMNPDGMNRRAIRSALGGTCTLFGVPFKYFRRFESQDGYEEVNLSPQPVDGAPSVSSKSRKHKVRGTGEATGRGRTSDMLARASRSTGR